MIEHDDIVILFSDKINCLRLLNHAVINIIVIFVKKIFFKNLIKYFILIEKSLTHQKLKY